MDARTIAQQVAYGRIALGAALTVAPGLATRAWVGADSRTTAVRVLGVGFGARDVGIGLGTLRALQSGSSPREWLLAGALADAADLLATLTARRDLPVLGRFGVAALAAGGASLGVWAARELQAGP